MNTLVLKPSIRNAYLEVHFNLWNSERNNLKFLDIGIMCDNKDQSFTLEIPSSNNINIIDLSDKLKGDIRNSIFNCYMDMKSEKSFEILNRENEKDEKFLLSPIKKQENLSPDNGIITTKIEVKEIASSELKGETIKKKYLRFRIENFDINKFVITEDSESKIFESSFMINKIIDFRFNDYRILESDKIQNYKLNEDTYTKIHFFYMTDALEDISICNDKYDVRFLERELWDNYLGIPKRKKDILVYHLKETSKSNASFLIKSQQEKTSKPHLLFYAFVVLDLAVLANNIFSILPIIKIPNQINWKCFILATLTALITPFIIIGISKLFKFLKKRLRK